MNTFLTRLESQEKYHVIEKISAYRYFGVPHSGSLKNQQNLKPELRKFQSVITL